jgi:hypothetical protein
MLKIRKAGKGDFNFIFDTSYKSIRKGLTDAGDTLDQAGYRQSMNSLHVFWKKNCEIDILCDDEFPEVIISYLIYKKQTDRIDLWFCYTKADFRRNSMLKVLINPLLQEDLHFRYFFKTYNLARWIKMEKSDFGKTLCDNLRLSPVYQGITQYEYRK